ncbi:unnamed protein product [Somion occarium]|uniref:Uncharacterized protein n=1 Tax=Somion occarium TaxID=3059160 RepID=A0ABP1DAI9_9APHY
MLSQITAANDSESQSQPADSYRPTTDVAVGSMGDTPNISLMTDGARYMMYGYCVSHTWLLMYARHHNLVTNNQRPDDLKAIFDIRKRINWHDIRSTTVPTKCVYRILHKDTGGTLKSMKGLDIVGNTGFDHCFVFASGSNRNATALATALDPEQIRLVQEVLCITSSPQWYLRTDRELPHQPYDGYKAHPDDDVASPAQYLGKNATSRK